MFLRLLEQSFLPDLRAATMLDSVSLSNYFSLPSLPLLEWFLQPKAAESDIALALNRYLCNAVLPLMTRHASFFADSEHQAALVDATLHTVYRMSKQKQLTNNQRVAVSDFLIAITRYFPGFDVDSDWRNMLICVIPEKCSHKWCWSCWEKWLLTSHPWLSSLLSLWRSFRTLQTRNHWSINHKLV